MGKRLAIFSSIRENIVNVMALSREKKITACVNDTTLTVEQKIDMLMPLFEDYYKFCFEKKTSPSRNLAEKIYIIKKASPALYTLPKNEVTSLVETIKESNRNVEVGITEEDASKFLGSCTFDVLNSMYNNDLLYPSFDEAYALSILVGALREIGIKCTFNNISDFNGIKKSYFFGTVTLRVVQNEKIVDKTYLIDFGYTRFFTLQGCQEGKFYFSGPDAGYYVARTEKGKKFAEELASKNFVELNSQNALTYIQGFEAESIASKNPNYVNVDGDNIMHTMITSNKELDYPLDTIRQEMGDTLNFKGQTI